MTNRQLQRMNNALNILGNRRMANVGADLKVARLLKILMPYVEPLDKTRRQVALETIGGVDAEELTTLQQQAMQLHLANAEAKLLDTEVDVELPLAYALKEADLPKEQTGKDGWTNASQLGAILAELGILFVEDEEKEDEKK